VFNIADSSITIGVGLLILGLLISERREKLAQGDIEDPVNSATDVIEDQS
jgi:hypothetical protein